MPAVLFTKQNAKQFADRATAARRLNPRTNPDLHPDPIPHRQLTPTQSVTVIRTGLSDADLTRRSTYARSRMATELERQLDVMLSKRPKRIADLGGRDGRTATAKSLVDALDTVFGWSEEGTTGIITAGMLPEPPDPTTAPTVIPPPPPTQGTLSAQTANEATGEAPLGGAVEIDSAPREISTPSQSDSIGNQVVTQDSTCDAGNPISLPESSVVDIEAVTTSSNDCSAGLVESVGQAQEGGALCVAEAVASDLASGGESQGAEASEALSEEERLCLEQGWS